MYIYCCSSCTSCLWWITHLMQRQRKGCNNIPSFLQWTAPIARSFCEGFMQQDFHILVTAPFCWRVSLCKHLSSIGESDSLCPMQWRKHYSGLWQHETRSKQGIWEVTLHNLLPTTLESDVIMLNGHVYWPLAQTVTCLYHDEETNISQKTVDWPVRQ